MLLQSNLALSLLLASNLLLPPQLLNHMVNQLPPLLPNLTSNRVMLLRAP